MTPQEFRLKADDFTKAYLEAALWAESAELGVCVTCMTDPALLAGSGCRVPTDENGRCARCGGTVHGTDRSFTDLGFEIEDINPEALQQIVIDCQLFQEHVGHLFGFIGERRAGHDFWLTRNEHGAGFWDGCWKEPEASALTKAAKSYPECSLYVGEDGRVYLA